LDRIQISAAIGIREEVRDKREIEKWEEEEV
jgi:hypothetical protein